MPTHRTYPVLRPWTDLRDLRQMRGIGQAEFSRLVNVSKSHQCDLERGWREPTDDYIRRAAAVLLVKPEHLSRTGAPVEDRRVRTVGRRGTDHVCTCARKATA